MRLNNSYELPASLSVIPGIRSCQAKRCFIYNKQFASFTLMQLFKVKASNSALVTSIRGLKRHLFWFNRFHF